MQKLREVFLKIRTIRFFPFQVGGKWISLNETLQNHVSNGIDYDYTWIYQENVKQEKLDGLKLLKLVGIIDLCIRFLHIFYRSLTVFFLFRSGERHWTVLKITKGKKNRMMFMAVFCQAPTLGKFTTHFFSNFNPLKFQRYVYEISLIYI